jgi:hypothetical protein
MPRKNNTKSPVENLDSVLKENHGRYEKEIYIYIFNLLDDAGIPYTSNNNGIFFELNSNKTHMELASKAIEYLEKIDTAIAEHNKNISTRESTEKIYKELIETSSKPRSIQKQPVENVYDDTKEAPDDLERKREYKGVYKRLNSIMMKNKRSVIYSFQERKPKESKTRDDDDVATDGAEPNDEYSDDCAEEYSDECLESEQGSEEDLFGDSSDED